MRCARVHRPLAHSFGVAGAARYRPTVVATGSGTALGGGPSSPRSVAAQQPVQAVHPAPVPAAAGAACAESAAGITVKASAADRKRPGVRGGRVLLGMGGVIRDRV